MKRRNLLVAGMCMLLGLSTLFSGCGINEDATLVNINSGEDSISLGYGNFVARYTQSLYDKTYLQYMGTEMWTTEQDGETMEEAIKDQVITSIEEDYLLVAHAADYDVALTDEEKESITEAAKTFIANNDEDTLTAMTATQDIVEEYMTNQAIAAKVEEAIKAAAEVTVTEEEAAQRAITYAYIGSVSYTDDSGNTVAYTDEQKEELLANAKTLATSTDLETDAETLGATVKTATYGEDEDTLDEAVVAAADALSEGQISDVVEVEDDGYYVIRLDSAFDEDATQEKMTSLEEEKREEALEDILDGWKEDITWDLDKKQWSKVKFDTLFENFTTEDSDSEE